MKLTEGEAEREEESGDRRFVWRGGHRCLDFVNTWAMRRGQPADLLQTPTDLVDWLCEGEVFPAAETMALAARWTADPVAGEAVLDAVRALRTQLRQMLESLVDGGRVSEDSVAAINSSLRRRPLLRQVAAGNEPGRFVERFISAAAPEGPKEIGADRILAALAESAANLLCDADLSRIRACESPRCILFFYDTSKNRTRRWCSMAACGNRMKAAAHFQRRRGSG